MGNKWLLTAVALYACIQFSVHSEEDAASPGRWENVGFIEREIKFDEYLGYTLKQAYEMFGPPEEVFTFRGAESGQDNVVFYYADHLYLFWYENRVWQVRLDERYKGTIAGIEMGISKGEILKLFDKPFYEDRESFIYILPDRGIPVRLRLYFKNDALVDAYVYRGDF